MLGCLYIRSQVIMPPDIQPKTLKELLTPKELEVAKLVADGMDNASIAAELGCAPNTVVSHIRNAFLKLRYKNRVQLATKYLMEDRPNV